MVTDGNVERTKPKAFLFLNQNSKKDIEYNNNKYL